MAIKEYLQIVEDVISEGKFKDNWESLSQITIPEWYGNGKFGLFIHWGCYSVPAFYNEWYPRLMYLKGHPAYKHRRKTYGKNSDYSDIVKLFNPDKFDATEWLDTFEQSGAKFIMPVCEHHDGIKMYQSDLNKWNMQELQGRDFIQEIKQECDKRELKFFASNHRAENYWFFNGAKKYLPQSEINRDINTDLYGVAKVPSGNINDDLSLEVSTEWLEDWLASACEMVDKLRPYAVYFDWWIYKEEFKPYIKKFLAYYYNRALEWDIQVCVFYKFGAIMKNCAVYDVERGQIDGVALLPWQNDTAIAKNSWGYTQGNEFKKPQDLIRNLIDVVSKNGCFMLNVGPKANGEICPEEKQVLSAIGQWLQINGEAIYDTKPFDVYREGKKDKANTSDNTKYDKKELRFTYKAGAIYCFPMSSVVKNKLTITSLSQLTTSSTKGIRYNINNVSILGQNNAIKYNHTSKGLELEIDGTIDCSMPICIKIEVD